MAAPFDQEALEISGNPVAVAEGLGIRSRIPTEGTVDLAISETGTLIYTSGSQVVREGRPVWMDREGVLEEIDPDWVAEFGTLALSPDGSRIAASLSGPDGRNVWVKELGSGTPMRLTFEGAFNIQPSWTSDGQSLSFVSDRNGSRDVYLKRADGGAAASLLWDDDRPLDGVIFSPDGEWVIYRMGSGGGRDFFLGRVGADARPEELIASEYEEMAPSLSPDGRWLAYHSNESGSNEVYVRPFPEVTSGKWMVSDGGASLPIWGNEGNELFYRSTAANIVAVQYSTAPTFDILGRRTLFEVTPNQRGPFGLALGDQRFLMIQSMDEAGDPGELIVVENFFEELKEIFGR
jgi:Tol biopolymer transport system component